MDQCKPLIEQHEQQKAIKSTDNNDNNLVDNLNVNLVDRNEYHETNNNIINNNNNEDMMNSKQCNSVSLVNRDYDISKLKYLVGLNLFNRYAIKK